MPLDLLSDMLDLLNARCSVSGRLVGGGAWAIQKTRRNAVSFCAATTGSCWYFREGSPDAVRFEAGDVLVVNFQRSVIWASDPSLASRAVKNHPLADETGAFRYGQGEDFCMISGVVEVDRERQNFIQSSLPPLIHVRGSTPEASQMGWLIAELLQETLLNPQPGRTTIVAALAQLLFARVLRAYLVSAPADDAGWLKVFNDHQLAAALAAIHGNPAHNWTVQELSKIAGMSRTAFAARFREVMGLPPIEYMTSWRMRLAKRALRAGSTVSEAAAIAGYMSHSGFSAAFQRSAGMGPGSYRRASMTQSQVDCPG